MTQAHTGGITMIKFMLALAAYIIDLARWIVWGIISLMEVVCAILVTALIIHAFNTYIN